MPFSCKNTLSKTNVKAPSPCGEGWGGVFCILLILLLFSLNLFVGAVDIPFAAVWASLTGGEVERASWQFIVVENRLPQAITAMLCGAGLAGSGLILQTVFRNPLAGPSILGIDTGANLGVAVVVLLLGSSVSAAGMSMSGFTLVVVAAMTGAMLIMALLMLFSHLLRTPVMLLITGIMVSFIVSPIISLLNFWATDEGVHSYIVWGMGSFGGVSLERLPLFAAMMTAGIVASVLLIKPLDLMMLGDRYAANLGLNVHRSRNLMLCVSGWMTAVSTAFCGPIAFVGLAVPHIARMTLRSPSHRRLLPTTLMMGATLTLACNLICTLPGERGMIPVNVITPLVGAPVILYVILKRRSRTV